MKNDGMRNQIIINGGDPLEGCPETWEEAETILNILNNSDNEYFPKWSFDCGFKLDFDGDIMSVSSRFYPPKEHYGPGWDGSVTIMLMGVTIREKEFNCSNLDELHSQVESYTKTAIDEICLPLFNPPVKGDNSNE